MMAVADRIEVPVKGAGVADDVVLSAAAQPERGLRAGAGCDAFCEMMQVARGVRSVRAGAGDGIPFDLADTRSGLAGIAQAADVIERAAEARGGGEFARMRECEPQRAV